MTDSNDHVPVPAICATCHDAFVSMVERSELEGHHVWCPHVPGGCLVVCQTRQGQIVSWMLISAPTEDAARAAIDAITGMEAAAH